MLAPWAEHLDPFSPDSPSKTDSQAELMKCLAWECIFEDLLSFPWGSCNQLHVISLRVLGYFYSILCKRIGWDSDLVVVLLNGPATFTESELKTTWKLTEPEKFHLNLDWEFTKLIIQSIFRSDSVNVAGPLSKTTTKSLSQPILSRLSNRHSSNMSLR